jgi:hypothetical protein
LSVLSRLYNDIKSELSEFGSELTGELQGFLPEVRDVDIQVHDLDIERLISFGDVKVDDGANTPLSQKGDGFKSLFGISMLQFIAQQRFGSNIIFGIEEPESHLHSSAVYEIKESLRGLSESFQVLLTTHSPILLQRDNIAENLIVSRSDQGEHTSTIRPARRLSELRQSLGIRPHENMISAEVVVVVEGASEESSMPSILSQGNVGIHDAIREGRVKVLSAGGASNMRATLRALARDVTSCIVFLDDDEAGRNAKEQISKSGLLANRDVFSVPSRDGCPDTEFEDLFDPEVYLHALRDSINLDVTPEEFYDARQRSGGRGCRFAKWSEVMRRLCNFHGIDFSDVELDAKEAIARAISEEAVQGRLGIGTWHRGLLQGIERYLRE